MIVQKRMETYDKLEKKIKKRYKKAKIRYKSDYLFWQLMPDAIRCSGITFGNTILMPARTYSLSMLAHEYTHLVQMHELGLFKFLFLYLQPQIISLLFFVVAILLGVFSINTLAVIVALVGLIPLGPWPAKKRMELETEGYAMNIAVEKWGYGKNSKQLQKYVVDSCLSWLYYKMTWNREEVNKLVTKMVNQVDKGPNKLMNNIAYNDVYEIFHNG